MLFIANISIILRPLSHPTPVIAPARPPPPPPLPTITYDNGLPSLPDDILCEIFGLLNLEALKSCSLTGRALSYLTKPFIHRILYLTPLTMAPTGPEAPGPWNEFKDLPAISERGLLQYARRISISLPGIPLFAHELEPHIQHLRKITNLKSLKIRWMDVPSFLPKMEEYFGTFFGTLQSLELESPRGDHEQILYFACQFRNLRDLKIHGLQDYFHSMRNDGPHFEIKTSPPLDGTLDLHAVMTPRSAWGDFKGPEVFFSNLVTLPSGLKFRALKLSRYIGNNLQLLVDPCAPTLEYMELTSDGFGTSSLQGGECSLFTPVHTISLSGTPRCPPLNFERHSALRQLKINLTGYSPLESAAEWTSETIPTITSHVFTKLAISIAPVSLFRAVSENLVRWWNLVDNVLDRLSLCEYVTLVVTATEWVETDKFGEGIKKYFPLMWEKGRVVLEIPPPPQGTWPK